MWDQGSTARSWSDVDPSFPDEPLKLFGPGPDSGTFDYFTEVINGKAKQSRSDYTPSEDDNALVTGVAGDKDALGYFGFAYLEENLDKIKAVAIDSGGGCVEPSADNVNGGKYKPLARPLFIYPSVSALKRPEFAAFVQYYLDNVNTYVDETGYIEAQPDVLAKSKADLAAALPVDATATRRVAHRPDRSGRCVAVPRSEVDDMTADEPPAHRRRPISERVIEAAPRWSPRASAC